MNKNKLAFPAKTIEPYGVLQQTVYHSGMTLRDYFAIHATEQDIIEYISCKPKGYISRECARYMYADAMMKQREVGNN
jgi:hypothetical protein